VKIWVLGASGMLGHKVCEVLGKRHEAVGFSRSATDPGGDGLVCDFSRESDRHDFESKTMPDAIVNCVGVIKQRPKAEADSADTILINSFLPHWLARLPTRLIHISTDCVFDGTLPSGQSYTEHDTPNATDLYGRSKMLGEIVNRPNALTLRTSILGRERSRHLGLLDWFLSQGGRTVRGFEQHIFSGVSTSYLAWLIGLILEEKATLHGLYHVTSAALNKRRLLEILRDALDMDVQIQVDQQTPPCNRALSGALLQKTIGIVQPTWFELADGIARDAAEYPKVRPCP